MYDAVAFVAPASLCGIRCPAKGMCRGGDLAVPTDYSRGGGVLPIEPMTPSVGSVSLLGRPVCSATAGHSRLSGAACVCHSLSVSPQRVRPHALPVPFLVPLFSSFLLLPVERLPHPDQYRRGTFLPLPERVVRSLVWENEYRPVSVSETTRREILQRWPSCAGEGNCSSLYACARTATGDRWRWNGYVYHRV